jgi:molybdopterin-guanine dinucleotide biosynthesis protein A
MERTAFVLAGGQSRRMGLDKAGLPWGNRTLLDHMIGLLGSVATTVDVVGGNSLPDLHPGRGPVEGIRTALEATATEENLIVAVDLPFLESGLLDYLMDRLHRTGAMLLACEIEGRVPMCLGVRKALLPAVEDYLAQGKRSVEGLANSVAHEHVTERDLTALGVTTEGFRNLNTREDYEKARQETFG